MVISPSEEYCLRAGSGYIYLFLKNGFLLVVIAVVYLQPWLKNKLVYVQYAKALIEIR
jgi:hypothetical protein